MHQETFQNSCVGHSVFHQELDHSICVCTHAQGYHRLCHNLDQFLLTFSLFTSVEDTVGVIIIIIRLFVQVVKDKVAPTTWSQIHHPPQPKKNASFFLFLHPI